MSEDLTGAVRGAPLWLLRAEGAALFVAMLAAYHHLAALPGSPSWWLFAILLLAPDLSMLGYLAGPRVGALAYNAAHTTLVPVLLGLAGLALESQGIMAVAVIWIAHIGLDRALGYGLKYPGAFRQTHLGLLMPGKARGAGGSRT
ncbi:MAG: DUF4260 domain-containing protein [Pseudomonadota bacterium]